MKNIYFLFVPLVAVFALSSCEKEKEESTDTTPVVLETPVLTISEQTSDSFTITWPSVTHAMYYEYEVNGETKSTSQPYLTESGLAEGSYVVKVMAKAAPESGYADSEWGSVTVDLKLEDDWFEIEQVYLKDDDVFNYYKYNSIWYVFTGHGVASVMMDVLTTEVVEDFGEDALPNILTQRMTDEGISVINSIGRLEGGMSGLEPDTEYVVVCYVTHESGVEKLVISDPITTDPVPEMPEGLEEWIGSYTVTSTQTLQLTADGSVPVYTMLDEPMTFDIMIEPSPNDVKTLYIYGWSILEEQMGARLPAMAQLSDDGRKGLKIVQGYIEYGGYTFFWMPICYRSDNQYQLLNFADDIFTLYEEDGVITASMYSGTSGGYDYDVVALDLFIMGSTVQIPHDIPAYFPAGGFTLVRTDSTGTSFVGQNETSAITVSPMN